MGTCELDNICLDSVGFLGEIRSESDVWKSVSSSDTCFQLVLEA